MKIRKAARYALRNRWKPSFSEVVAKTIRRHFPEIIANMVRNNAFLSSLTNRG